MSVLVNGCVLVNGYPVFAAIDNTCSVTALRFQVAQSLSIPLAGFQAIHIFHQSNDGVVDIHVDVLVVESLPEPYGIVLGLDSLASAPYLHAILPPVSSQNNGTYSSHSTRDTPDFAHRKSPACSPWQQPVFICPRYASSSSHTSVALLNNC